jgi:hypothetical protein
LSPVPIRQATDADIARSHEQDNVNDAGSIQAVATPRPTDVRTLE